MPTRSRQAFEQLGPGKSELHSSAAYRPGSGARAAGIENGGRLDRGESNHRARLAFKGLSPAGCPFPACVAPAEAAGAFRRGGASGGYRPAAGSGARAVRRLGRLAAAGRRNLSARQCPRAVAREEYAAYCIVGLSDKLANAGG